jgi:hypothetical protein
MPESPVVCKSPEAFVTESGSPMMQAKCEEGFKKPQGYSESILSIHDVRSIDHERAFAGARVDSEDRQVPTYSVRSLPSRCEGRETSEQ